MTIPNRPTRGLKIVYALLAELGLELECLTALQREMIRLVVSEHDAMFEDVKNRYERKLRDMLSSVDFGALSHGPERVHETPLALGLRGLDQAMLQFTQQMEQLLCAKIRHVITVAQRTLVDEYLKLCFDSEPYPTTSVRERVSALTGLSVKQVTMWYANARTRLKRKGGELRSSRYAHDTLPESESHPDHTPHMVLHRQGDYAVRYIVRHTQ